MKPAWPRCPTGDLPGDDQADRPVRQGHLGGGAGGVVPGAVAGGCSRWRSCRPAPAAPASLPGERFTGGADDSLGEEGVAELGVAGRLTGRPLLSKEEFAAEKPSCCPA